MSTTYIAPEFMEKSFHCPHCRVLAVQSWPELKDRFANFYVPPHFMTISTCTHCKQHCIWHDEKLLYPFTSQAEPASPDLPEAVRADYDEALSIVSRSPRGAAALLRLALQKLCRELGEPGKSINTDIKSLVGKGLPPGVQKALDAVRVIGNEAVHPGTLDLNDNRGVANSLFSLVNLITAKMITEPKELDAIYKQLPETSRDAIEKRDGSSVPLDATGGNCESQQPLAEV